MNDKTTGFLFGAGIGLGVAWVVRMLGNGDQERIIILKTGDKGTLCMRKPDDVVIQKKKKLTWWVVNLSTSDVDVSIRNWRDEKGNPKTAAVESDPNDQDDPPQNQLSRTVPHGTVRKIRSKARAPLGLLFEDVHYDVYLNGSPGADPIVKLTP
jgi:hypothetical protein